MARLLVEAVTSAVVEDKVFVTVSRANDGTPVTGLGKQNFRLASSWGLMTDFTAFPYERKWEPGAVEHSGCYMLSIGVKPIPINPDIQDWVDFVKGARYVFGIQVRTLTEARPPQVIDQGQTIVELLSTGT